VAIVGQGGRAKIHAPRTARIEEHDGLAVLDFRCCRPGQRSEIYQDFGLLCARQGVHWVLLRAGDEEADFHYSVRDVLRTVVLVAEVRLQLRVGVISSSRAIALVWQDMAEELRVLGCIARVFPAEPKAYEWLGIGDRCLPTSRPAGPAAFGAGAGIAA
jgi:hypothetical protein